MSIQKLRGAVKTHAEGHFTSTPAAPNAQTRQFLNITQNLSIEITVVMCSTYPITPPTLELVGCCPALSLIYV